MDGHNKYIHTIEASMEAYMCEIIVVIVEDVTNHQSAAVSVRTATDDAKLEVC